MYKKVEIYVFSLWMIKSLSGSNPFFSVWRSSMSSAVSLIETLRVPRSLFFLLFVEASDLSVDLSDFWELDDLEERLAEARVLELLVSDPESGLEALIGLESVSKLLEFSRFGFLFFFLSL